MKAFGNSIEKAQESAVLAANQGLYNGFLSAGLVWGLFHPDPTVGFQIKMFFLLCVIVAGVFGAATASRKILLCRRRPPQWRSSCSGWRSFAQAGIPCQALTAPP